MRFRNGADTVLRMISRTRRMAAHQLMVPNDALGHCTDRGITTIQ